MGLSCGVMILGHLDTCYTDWDKQTPENNAESVIRKVARKRFGSSYDARFSQVVFSHRESNKYAEALVDLIKEKKLGSVVASKPILNENTQYTTIVTYIWNIENLDALKEFNVPEPRPKRTKSGWWY